MFHSNFISKLRYLQKVEKPKLKDCRDKIRDIYNARLKVERIATEIDQLAQYGTILPDNMQGLNDDQIAELKESFFFEDLSRV